MQQPRMRSKRRLGWALELEKYILHRMSSSIVIPDEKHFI